MLSVRWGQKATRKMWRHAGRSRPGGRGKTAVGCGSESLLSRLNLYNHMGGKSDDEYSIAGCNLTVGTSSPHPSLPPTRGNGLWPRLVLSF